MKTTALAGKDKIKVIFIRGPRHFWPIINESDNFLLPLGYPALAAYLRKHMKNVELEIIDCCPEKIGWATLRKMLEEKKPDVVGIGEKVVPRRPGMAAGRTDLERLGHDQHSS